MFKGICLDLFHTLIDVGQVPDEIGRYTADILGIDREAWNQACFSDAHEICRPTDHYTSVKLLAHSLDPSIADDLIHQAIIERQRRFNYALLNVSADVLDTLEKLNQLGLKLALVSNASTSEVSAWQDSPLAKHFHSAIFSCDVGLRKPQIGIYQYAIDAIELSAAECLFVGDGGSDEHLGARAAGLTPVLITRHIHQQEKLKTQRQRVDFEIDQLHDLLAILNDRHKKRP
ncbi:MAG: HAD family hydrolase [Gammaproteobacteria bacterium]|nr:HAD family hydrolase [Gammaproteobacteria bacterium]